MARAGARRLEFVADEPGTPPGPDPTSEPAPTGKTPQSLPRRRRRASYVAGAAVAVLLLAGATTWENRHETAALRARPGVVTDLASPPAEVAAVDVDTEANLTWLGDDLMVSRAGALVGLDPARGTERWRIDDVGDARCSQGTGASNTPTTQARHVTCLTADNRLLVVDAGGTVSAEAKLPPADTRTVLGNLVVQATWVGDNVHVAAFDVTGRVQWSTTLPHIDGAVERCAGWRQDPDTGDWESVWNDRALELHTTSPTTITVDGCGIFGKIDSNGDVSPESTNAARGTDAWYSNSATQWDTDHGTWLRVLYPGTLTEASTQILDDGVVALTVPGQILVPLSSDATTNGWYARRLEGLVRVDDEGHKIWSTNRYPDNVVAALAGVSVLSDYTNVWALDTLTGAQLWDWESAEVTDTWERGDAPYGFSVASAFTDGQIVVLAFCEIPADYGGINPGVTGLVALDATTGTLRWHVPPTTEDTCYTAIAGHLVAVRMSDGDAGTQLVFYG